MAQYAVWLAGLSPTISVARALASEPTEAAAPLLTSYRPIVLFLSAISR